MHCHSERVGCDTTGVRGVSKELKRQLVGALGVLSHRQLRWHLGPQSRSRRGWLRVYHSLRRSTFRRRAFAIAMMTCLACAHCERNKAVKSNTVKVRALRNKMYECSPPPYLSCVGTRTSFQSPQKCTEHYVVHGVAAPVLRRSERFKSITLHAVLHVGDGKGKCFSDTLTKCASG